MADKNITPGLSEAQGPLDPAAGSVVLRGVPCGREGTAFRRVQPRTSGGGPVAAAVSAAGRGRCAVVFVCKFFSLHPAVCGHQMHEGEGRAFALVCGLPGQHRVCAALYGENALLVYPYRICSHVYNDVRICLSKASRII